MRQSTNSRATENHDRLIKPLIALMAASHLAFVVAGMFFRFIDGDEGGMLTLSKEVINGRVPILDINAHNQPVFYYLYGGWMKLFGFSIVSARSLSAIAVFGVGLILIWWTRRFTKNWLVTAVVYLLYITSLTYFKTNIPVKPFALSNLFTFASFALLSGIYVKRGSFTLPVLFIAGLFLGLSMGVRYLHTSLHLRALDIHCNAAPEAKDEGKGNRKAHCNVHRRHDHSDSAGNNHIYQRACARLYDMGGRLRPDISRQGRES